MIAAIAPISFMSLAPVMPVSLGGVLGPALAPAAVGALPGASTIVSLASAAGANAAAGVPLTYTATGTFRTSLQITPLGATPTTGTPGAPIAQRVHLEFDADLDLLIIRDRATAGLPFSALPPDTVRRLADAMTTDLLLASLGASSGTTGNLAGSMLTGLFGGSSLFGGGSSPLFGGSSLGVSPLLGNTLAVNTANTTTPSTSITGTVTTNLTLTFGPTTPAAPTTAPATTAVSAALPGTATPAAPTAVTATPAAAVTAPATTVAVTPTPAAAATPGAPAADAALQRFLTDAAARALDTIANNPSYAAAAATLYASVAVARNQNEIATLAVPGRDDAIRQINPTVAVQPLPSSVA